MCTWILGTKCYRGCRGGTKKAPMEISLCLQIWVFLFNATLFLFGLLLIALGIWVYSERDTYEQMQTLSSFIYDPGTVVLVMGSIIFIVGLIGFLGALRLSPTLLIIYSVLLGLLILLQLIAACLMFLLRDRFQDKIADYMIDAISAYRDNVDLQNFIDWSQQEWLSCCGVKGPDDWNRNVYFNCSSPTREACGAPFSCCLPERYIPEGSPTKNTMCAYDVRRMPKRAIWDQYINVVGCQQAVNDWLDENIVVVAAVTVAIACIQLIGLCSAINLHYDMFDDYE